MNHSEIIEAALASGIHQSAIIETAKIVFDAAFRPYCEENLCGQYGVNHSCPPDCGTPEQMKANVLAYKKAVVVRTEWAIDDFTQIEKIREAKKSHNAAMFQLLDKLKADGHHGFMIGASSCMLCDPCKRKSGEPCAHPELQYSCMAAYCIHVKKLAGDCGMKYDYKDGILPFFGMYVFE